MPDSMEHALTEAALRVLETAAFMTVWPWSAQDGDGPPPAVAANMMFSGPCSGRLTIRVAPSVIGMLAMNMLGECEECGSEDEQPRDALKEVLNMICGNVLTLWFGENPVFELSPPQMVEPGMAVMPFGDRRACVALCLENTRAEVDMEIESGPDCPGVAAESVTADAGSAA